MYPDVARQCRPLPPDLPRMSGSGDEKEDGGCETDILEEGDAKNSKVGFRVAVIF